MPNSPHTDSSSVLSSAPPSPATTMSVTHRDTDPTVDNSLDDIFGSSPPEVPAIPVQRDPNSISSTTEPSDLPSLRRQHVTAGYRDGVSIAKGEHVQRGFDTGFPVGAQLGMRAGTILGILEGILKGLDDRSASGVVKKPAGRMGSASASASASRSNETRAAEADEDLRNQKREEILKIYREAVKALSVQSVFAGSGTAVGSGSPAPADSTTGNSETAETQLGRKGDAVISQWEEKMMVHQWELNMEALEMKGPSEECKPNAQGPVGERS
ncbi:Protein yae1 [Penicillium oxalicum]|uniref:Protein yae1 n=1 Tax=Penicillium oxalicum TaxID=69781 RepID=UPI0020B6B727|nr:Protein yae1 [Penicillium oxalicum]KAI2786491.1 Protein yae1 [Penicillium oxalicum]